MATKPAQNVQTVFGAAALYVGAVHVTPNTDETSFDLAVEWYNPLSQQFVRTTHVTIPDDRTDEDALWALGPFDVPT